MTHSKFPALRWDAAGNVHHCETEDDVQPGWTDYHPDSAPVSAILEKGLGADMTRTEIITALEDGGVTFSKNAPTAALAKQLRVAVLSALEEHDVKYDNAASTKDLLALIPAPE